MSKYTYTVNSIKALKENSQNRAEQYVTAIEGLLDYGYRSDEDLDYLIRNCDSTAELIATGAQWGIEEAQNGISNSFQFLAGAVGVGAGNAVDIAMLIPSYSIDVADSIYYDRITTLGAMFGFNVNTSDWEEYKKFYDEFSSNAFDNTIMLLSDDGNYYIDNEAMQRAYDWYADAWAGNGTAYSLVSGNRLKGTITNTLNIQAFGINDTEAGYIHNDIAFVGDFSVSSPGKLIITQHSEQPDIGETGDKMVYSYRIMAPADTTVTVTYNRTFQRNGETYRADNNFWGSYSGSRNYAWSDSHSSAYVTIDGVIYYQVGTLDMYQGGTSSLIGWKHCNNINGWWRNFPPYDGDRFGYVLNTQYFSGTFGTAKPSLSEIPNTTHPTPGGSVRTTYPTWYNSRKDRTIDKDGDPEQNNRYYYPWIPLADLDNIDSTTINNLYEINNYYTIEDKDIIIDPDFVDDANDDSEKASDDNPGNNPLDPSGGDTGNTDVPGGIIPITSNNDTGFVAIYHPTKEMIRNLANWLWSVGFDLDTFKKLFQDPMQAIISLHQIYVTPDDAGRHNIMLGFIDSTINSWYIDETQITLDCGTVIIPEMYKNALDYAPTAKAEIFLPFIGFREISINDIMGKNVNVTYNIDLLTGACVAFVVVNSGSYQGILYSFSGNCAVEMPLSSANFSGIISNIIGIAGSIGATIATGGAMAPVAIGASASALTNSNISIERGGSLSANAGALSGKKPYIIVTRPRNKTAQDYNKFAGYPTSINTKLEVMKGFTRIKEIILDSLSATSEEKNMLRDQLRTGVII